MESWLYAALDYIPRWIDYQMRLGGQPGCALAVAHKGRIVLERAFGSADLGTGKPLQDASEISVLKTARDGTGHGQITLAGGYASHGGPARLVRGSDGQIAEVWLGGNRLMPQAKVARELARRYKPAK